MNRFNQLLDYGQYVPLVQPLPYDALAQYGAGIEKRADEDLAGAFKLKELAKAIKYDPADQEYFKQFMNEWTPVLDNVASLAIKGDKNARKSMYEALAKWNADTRVNIFGHNYELGKKARESYASLAEKFGISPYGWSDTWTRAAQSRSELSPINWQGHDPWKEHYTDAARVVSGIKETDLYGWGNSLEYLQIDPQTNALVLNKAGKARGIDSARIESVVNSNLSNYVNTEGGRSRYKDLVYNGATHEEAITEMAKELYAIASKQFTIDKDVKNTIFAPDGLQNQQPKYTVGIGAGEKPNAKVAEQVKNSLPRGNGNWGGLIKITGAADDFPSSFEHKILLQKANKALGRSISGGQEAVDLVKQYLDDYGNAGFYPTYILDTNPTTLKRTNDLLFSNNQMNYAGEVISEGGGKKTPARKWFTENSKNEPTTSGTLPLINKYGVPYGVVLNTTTDNKEHIINNPLKQIHEEDVLVSDMGRSVFSPIPIPIKMKVKGAGDTQIDKTFYVDFEPDSFDDLTDSGQAKTSASGIVRLYDKDGNEIANSGNVPLPDEVAFRTLLQNMRK